MKQRSLLKASAILSLVFFSQFVHAIVIRFDASLSGAAEAPPNASDGIGKASVWIDTVLHTMRVKASFSGLTGLVSAAHIHAATESPLTGTAGVATQTPTFLGFPSGMTSGSYDSTFDLTQAASFRAGYITANGGTPATAEAALLAALQDEKAYFNIHTSFAPGGEIRGFFTERVPDVGSSALLLATGLLALAELARRRRRS